MIFFPCASGGKMHSNKSRLLPKGISRFHQIMGLIYETEECVFKWQEFLLPQYVTKPEYTLYNKTQLLNCLEMAGMCNSLKNAGDRLLTLLPL